MDTRIKDKTKIFGNGDITQAEQNYTGCFGYFANKAEDFNNLENTFYGQFIGTDYSDRRFYTPDPETGNALKFLMFLPEEFVSDDLVEVPDSEYKGQIRFDTRIKDPKKILAITDFERICRVEGRTMYPESNNPANEFLGDYGYFANKLEDFENLDNTLFAQFIEYANKPTNEFFCTWIEKPNNVKERKKFIFFLPREFVIPAEIPETLEEFPGEIEIPEYPDYL